MKYLIFLFSIISLPLFGQGLKSTDALQKDSVYSEVKEMPKFKGDLNKYLSDNIRYPEIERDSNITGTVYITFVVEKNGTISGVKILRGVPRGPGLDAEAVRVISSMPAWTPGKQNGKVVRVQFTFPIHFLLR